MTGATLDSEKLYHSFVSGAHEVLKMRTVLNEINVFPVPDGDTGNNLASTMRAMMAGASAKESIKKTLRSISDAILIGARGNSGMIFAQYISGMMVNLEDKEQVTVPEFAESARSAVSYAYRAIAHPVEGTMITVIREWAEAFYAVRETAADFVEAMSHSLEAAYRALKQTPEKLAVLKKAGVVDSGAKGFFHFVEGVTRFLKTGISSHIPAGACAGAGTEGAAANAAADIPAHVHAPEDSLKYRYCTEALLEGELLDDVAIRQAVCDLGDSLITAGMDTRMRIHLHTDRADEFFMRLRSFGAIMEQKADDMKRQYEAAHHRRHPIALVTDSIADLPADLMDRYQIHMLPLHLILEGSSYLDKVTITADSFYRLMDEGTEYPTSAQPTIPQAEELFSFLLAHYDAIIAITVSKEMSGTWQAMSRAAERLQGQGKPITVINSRVNSGAEGLLVLKAAMLIEEGRPYEEVVHMIGETIPKAEILVSVRTLKYMVRAGRVSKVTGLVGRLINLKPVIAIDGEGKGEIRHKSFSVRKSLRRILTDVRRAAAEGGSGIWQYALVHARGGDTVESLLPALKDITGREPAYVMDISPIVAMNAGLGSVAVALIRE